MTDRAASVKESIHVDEIGIEYARYGEFVLKTAYQPIFRRRRQALTPIGVEALAKVFREGWPIDTASFFAGVPVEKRFLLESLCRRLHLRNYPHIGVQGLRFFFNFDPRGHTDVETMVEQIRYMVSRLDAHDLAATQLVCEFTEDRVADETMLLRIAEEMRMHGMSVAMDDFGAGHSTPERIDMLRPDIVKLDGAWFRRVATLGAAADLLKELVCMLQQRSIEVLVEGIETAHQLKVACDCGADLLQGFLLGRPALAGTLFDTSVIDAEAITKPAGNVLPMARGRGARGTG